jgi:hypothetical protein
VGAPPAANWGGDCALAALISSPTTLHRTRHIRPRQPVLRRRGQHRAQPHTPPHLQGQVTAATTMTVNLAQTLSITMGAALIDIVGYQCWENSSHSVRVGLGQVPT